jgi:hypothetical protein
MDLNQPARPPRHSALQPYLQNQLTWGTLLSLAGGLRHAGSDENPRPMEHESLEDLRGECERATAPIRQTVPDALWLIFWTCGFKVQVDRGLRVPAAHLWWVAQEADTVLLSDGFTHHYTTIGQIDRERETILFLDPWPDEFFLQAGRNVLGIESDGCTLARTEFERATVGVLTWDTTKLLDAYFEAFPDQGDDADQRLRAGYAVMAAGPESLAGYAVKHFFASARIADLGGVDEAALQAIARAWLAAMCGIAAAVGGGNRAGQALLEQMATMAQQRAPARELIARLTPNELCRLAHNAGQLGHMSMAEATTAAAIAKDPACQEAYRLRARVRSVAAPALAIADARRALEINASEISRLEQEVARLRKPHPGGPTEYKLRREKFRRDDALNILVTACSNAGDVASARSAAIDLCAVQPTSIDAWHKRLVLERLAGDAQGSALAASTLLSLHITPELRAEAEETLKNVQRS